MLEPLLGAHQAPQRPRPLLLWPLNLAPLVWVLTLSCERPAALARAWTCSESHVQWTVGGPSSLHTSDHWSVAQEAGVTFRGSLRGPGPPARSGCQPFL